MRGEPLQCTLEVRVGPADRTRRSFSMECEPSTLQEVVEALRAQDLRLQNSAFDLSVGCGDNDSLRQLLDDSCVVEFFSTITDEHVIFVVVLVETKGKFPASMLADEGLVHLCVYHPGEDKATEKRFIPPRRGVREALIMAVRDAVPLPPPPSLPMQLYAVGSGICDVRIVDDDDAANTLLQRCLATQTVCGLTYRFPALQETDNILLADTSSCAEDGGAAPPAELGCAEDGGAAPPAELGCAEDGGAAPPAELDCADAVDIEVECSLCESDVVVFPFSWRRDSLVALVTLRKACVSVLGITTDDNVHLYDRDGTPLGSNAKLRAAVKRALQGGCTRVKIVVGTGHPCTAGLPLQCFVSWSKHEVILTCAVLPDSALEDLQRAILREYGMSWKGVGCIGLALRDSELGGGVELMRENAYEQLKAAASAGELLQITVSGHRSLLHAPSERILSVVVASFATEVALLLGESFSAQDVLPFFEWYREEMESCDTAEVDYLEMISLLLKRLDRLSEEKLTTLLKGAAVSCDGEGVLRALDRCVVVLRIFATRCPLDAVRRFFRRMYKSIQCCCNSKGGIPLAIVTQQLAQAGVKDVSGVLRCDHIPLTELHEGDYTELLLRIYKSDANLVCRAAVAAQLSGACALRCHRVMDEDERKALQMSCRQEVRHAFDGIRSADVAKFLQMVGLSSEPRYHCLLDAVGALLSTHPVEGSRHWLVERFKGKMETALYAKLRTFEDSSLPTPQLYRLCWNVLRPEIHHLILLAESDVASAMACWAFFALQLVCVNRHLEFPMVPLVDLQEFSPLSTGATLVAHVTTPPVAPPHASTSAAAVPRCPWKKPKLKYKYSYLCQDLRRSPHLPPPVK